MIGFDSGAERRGFRWGFLAGIVAAGVVAMCMAPPAHAAPFATATGPDRSTITLRTDKGPCLGDALLAVWQPEDASREVPGCWVVFVRGDGAEFVLVSFLDGERADIPRPLLVKVRGS